MKYILLAYILFMHYNLLYWNNHFESMMANIFNKVNGQGVYCTNVGEKK